MGCPLSWASAADPRGRAHEMSVTDAVFNRGCTSDPSSAALGSDLNLVSTSSKADAIVQSVEIYDRNF